jgi:hypothetical protein
MDREKRGRELASRAGWEEVWDARISPLYSSVGSASQVLCPPPPALSEPPLRRRHALLSASRLTGAAFQKREGEGKREIKVREEFAFIYWKVDSANKCELQIVVRERGWSHGGNQLTNGWCGDILDLWSRNERMWLNFKYFRSENADWSGIARWTSELL